MRMTIGLAAVLFHGAIFGFFFAWICSTMWGLDGAEPNVAIAAMQAMNASVRNAVFAPAFFGTPLVSALAALLAFSGGRRRAGALFLAAAVVYAAGGAALTFSVNVPMNEALALVEIPADRAAAAQIWRDFSQPWQVWNAIRAGFSGLALALAACGFAAMSGPRKTET